MATACFPTLVAKACRLPKAAWPYFSALHAFLSFLISKLDLQLGRIEAKITCISA